MPEQNGVTERVNRTLAEHSRAMLLDSGLPRNLWSYSMVHVTWLKNQTPTRALKVLTPYEARYGSPPDLWDLHHFGAKVWVRKESAGKLESKAREGRFVGYSQKSKGYQIYWPDKRSITVERNVRFVEDEPDSVKVEDVQLEGAKADRGEQLMSSTSPSPTPQPPSETLPATPPPSEPSPSQTNQDDEEEESAPPEEAAGRGQRVHKPSKYVRRLQQGEGTVDGRTSAPPKGIQPAELMGAAAVTALVTIVNVSDDQDEGMHFEEDKEDAAPHAPPPIPLKYGFAIMDHALLIHEGQEPRTLEEAKASPDWPQWEAAIDKEIKNLCDHDTYNLVEPLPNANIVGCRFVFHIKRDADGSITQFKARLVAQGYTQMPGVDFNETFAPVTKLSSICTILALTARYDWELEQMDVKSAYLNGRLDEEIYMRQPPGSAPAGLKHLVCHLKKTLYGLKQAGHGWYKTLANGMAEMGFTCCASDHAVWYKRAGDSIVIVASSVDDLTIAGTRDFVMDFKSAISARFEMSDLGAMRWILGIEVQRDRQARMIAISQRTYIDTVAVRFNLETANPVSTPLQPGGVLNCSQSPSTPHQVADMSNVSYREAVGSLMYAVMGTRPDIAFAVTTLSQFMQNPGRTHWEAIKHVIRYLVGTRELWLIYRTSDDGIQGFSDTDWGSSTEHCHSISGYVFTLDGGVISWSSKKQNVVALSSTEAEYIALTHASKEALWLRYLLSDIIHPDISRYPLTLFSDNRSAITLAKDNAFHPRMKHIDIRFHFIREAVDDEKIVLQHRCTGDMPADLFTKALPRSRIDHLRLLFGLCPL
ncbi:hypothetical protein BN946_scf184851.g4 [Trametes cinnabarina]|uniref:Integrase catalytic domain-containing protein n=1 Tax=Pycnoporus cinnabarinus TaxID=5643 RepID=A0A060S5X4_PYCCI|nr:hypothetical protein BN946_scf184851.g4 [Trametes cinnabarina]